MELCHKSSAWCKCCPYGVHSNLHNAFRLFELPPLAKRDFPSAWQRCGSGQTGVPTPRLNVRLSFRATLPLQECCVGYCPRGSSLSTTLMISSLREWVEGWLTL